ncbi:MAG: LytTR family transcriptional regulator, partial [bacterium]|nr:LytTR family transcriptional regulator [bacterium]
AEGKYISIHTAEDSHLLRDTMSSIEKRLDPSLFARIHRSHIVNIEYIKEIQPWSHGDYIIIMENESKLTLSRRYSDALLNRRGL